MSKQLKSKPPVGSDELLVVNRRIQKTADELGLKISKYEGFARGGWGVDGNGYSPAGMWVFAVEASDPSKAIDQEPAGICAENITEALKEMREWAEYIFPTNEPSPAMGATEKAKL
jgi:hypothetical protein